jgi:hypothetical protein
MKKTLRPGIHRHIGKNGEHRIVPERARRAHIQNLIGGRNTP